MPTRFPPAISRCRNPRASRLNLRKRPDPKTLTKMAEAWRPWRGVAAHLLWAYYHVVKRREGISLQPATKKPPAKKKTATRKIQKWLTSTARASSRAQGKAKHLVVFLHGYGADGNDLIEIGRAWQGLLPDAAFVSPHAPRPCGQAPVGREWFPLTFRDPNERWVGVQAAAPMLNAFLDAELQRRQLPPSALALVGFSQGTMMALHVGLRRAVKPAAIVGYSGMLVMPEDVESETFAAEITAKPPVLLIHGDADELIPVQAMFHCRTGARRARHPGRMAHLVRNRPRHRPGRPAPGRRVHRTPFRPELSHLRVTSSPDFTILSRCTITSG